jgi:hypothetical protein
MMNDVLFDIKEAAYALGLAPRTLRRMVQRKEIECIQYKPGGPIHFAPKVIEDYKRRHTKPAKELKAFRPRRVKYGVPNHIPPSEWGRST